MDGSPLAGSRWNPVSLRPGADFSEEAAIQAGPSQVMQKTGNLILAHTLGSMSQCGGHGSAHARRADSMGPVIAPNDTSLVKGMRHVVQAHEPGNERAGNQERGALGVHRLFDSRFVARRISVEETECQGKIARTLDQW